MAHTQQARSARDSEPGWPRGFGPVRDPLALNDNHAASRICPACGAWAPVAPVASDYLGGGLIRHHWVCEPCGHAWVTGVRILS